MIEYSPNRDWFRDLRHLGASWTLRRVLRAAIVVGIYAAGVCTVVLNINLEGYRPISGSFSLLGLILSIIVAYRTNTAYERWWEGRKQWGILSANSRNLAIHLDALLHRDDRPTRAAFVRLLGNFAVALSHHLRGQSQTDRLVPPGPDEACTLVREGVAPGHVPLSIAHEIIVRVHAARQTGLLDSNDLIVLAPHLQTFLEVAGACDRIRNTPIPFSYSVFIKMFIVIYAMVLPVGLAPEYGYLAVPLTMLLVFALLGLELMAEEIEEPFGLDCNDLPTETLAAGINANVTELLGFGAAAPAPAHAPYSKFF